MKKVSYSETLRNLRRARRQPDAIDTLVSTRMAIESKPDDESERRFMARMLLQATLPHSKPDGTEFVRTNGNLTLTAVALSDIGLPYGSIPRLLLAWMTTEAVKTKTRELVLGDSLSGFMRQLGLVPTGGRWGSIRRIKDQTRRLFNATFRARYADKRGEGSRALLVADRHILWWDTPDPMQTTLWQSTVTLSETFFNEITDGPVPIDMRALRALKQSPMALDIYMWLTHRMSYLSKPTVIGWALLQAQFGAGYPTTPAGLRHFKQKFLKSLDSVRVMYPEAKTTSMNDGLRLLPSLTHVAKKSIKLF